MAWVRRMSLVLAAAGAAVLAGGPLLAAEEKKEPEKAPPTAAAVKAKPLSDNVKKGLDWLVKGQMENGAWTQGEESQHMGTQRLDKPSVADTCVAALALLRAGNTPKEGDYAKNVLKAAEFVCGEIEKSKESDLWVTDTRGTRVQQKIGTYIDTFMACLLLSELKGKMPDKKSGDRLVEALNKVVRKISENQKADGTWANQGWAPTLGQAVASKGLNRAAQSGIVVNDRVLAKTEEQGRKSFDAKGGKFAAPAADSAGVALYGVSSSVTAMTEADNTYRQKEDTAREVLKTSKDEKEIKDANEIIRRAADNRKDLQSAQAAVVKNMEDPSFAAGFGSNGGEEFLSHLSIGESLVAKGGADWEKWDKSMTENMNKIQNKDGSWSGHHCITGRTFCTSTALMVLMVDRTPAPIAGELKRK